MGGDRRMLLTRFAVDNLLSLRNAEMRLDPGLTVVVGPNGSGKTNLVRVLTVAGLALEWLEERSSHVPGPQGWSAAQNALASFAASRCRAGEAGSPIGDHCRCRGDMITDEGKQ